MAQLDDVCECGCELRFHRDVHPHICISDIMAWWPDVALVGSGAQANHCPGFRPASCM